MAMRQHDAIRPKDRVDGRCFGKKRMDRRIKFICPFDLADGLQRRTNACLKISLHSVTIVLSILPKRIHH